MTGQTHLIVGANVAWLVVLASVEIGASDMRLLLLVLAGAFGALLPDLDAGAAKIHFIALGVLRPFQGIAKHRGGLHSLLAALVVFVIAYFLLRNFDALLGLDIALGYVSHLVIDGLNFGGVPLLWPLKTKFHLVPKFFRSPVKGLVDQSLFVIGLLGIGLLFLTRYTSTGF